MTSPTLPRPDAPAGVTDPGAFLAHSEAKHTREQQAIAMLPREPRRPIGKRLPKGKSS